MVNPIYGIILPDISRKLVGNVELNKDSETDSYNIYLSNIRKLLDYVESNDIPNFFGINRSLLNLINGSGEIDSEIIIPLNNTTYVLVYDNILFSKEGFNKCDIAGLYMRNIDNFIKVDDVPEEYRDQLKHEGRILPFSQDIENNLGYVEAISRRLAVEGIMLSYLVEAIKLFGYDEIRIAGERLWYLGGSDIDGPAHIRNGNISEIVDELNNKERGNIKTSIIKNCVFPLEDNSFDGRYENYYNKKGSKKWIVKKQLEDSISLDEVLDTK